MAYSEVTLTARTVLLIDTAGSSERRFLTRKVQIDFMVIPISAVKPALEATVPIPAQVLSKLSEDAALKIAAFVFFFFFFFFISTSCRTQ